MEIDMSINSNLRQIAAAAALGLAGVGAAQADAIVPPVTVIGNFTFGVAGLVALPGMISAPFAYTTGRRFIVHFASECAVAAPAGNTTAWTDVDIEVINGAGGIVQVLPPTAGNLGAFCASNGTAASDGWESNAVIAVGGPNLASGVYRVRVRARMNNGATQAWFGERTLVVTR
jgi:hypothetical protein